VNGVLWQQEDELLADEDEALATARQIAADREQHAVHRRIARHRMPAPAAAA
jgi:hypothetical protein